MIGVTDLVGLGTLISAIGASVVSIIVALRQTHTIATGNTIKDAVTTSNGQTLADLAEENQARNIRVDTPPEPPAG